MSFISTKNIKGDITGGITAGIVALPLALAFGIQAFGGINDPSAASMGALAGLVGATLLGFFAALFGGTPSQISGPTGPMTVITAGLISGVWASSSGNLSTVLITMSLAGLFCGLFQILFGIIKLGKLVRYIPYPVLSGFMSGIGVIIILQQIYPLFGMKSPVLVVDMILDFPEIVSEGFSLEALLLGLGTIAIISLLPKVIKNPNVPVTLVALVVMTLIALPLGLADKYIIGSIPTGLPMPFFANGSVDLSGIDWTLALKHAVIPGLTLAGLGSIDTLLTSVVADNITKTKHDSNQELIGQGNAMAGLFCGISGAGATMRTVVNVRSGGRGKISGMVHAMLLLAILLGLGSLVKHVPLAVLAGILITVGWGIIDFRGFRDLRKIPHDDAFVLIVVFLTTVFVDLLTAVGIGMVIACVLFMKRASDMVEKQYDSHEINGFDKENPWPDEGGMPDKAKHSIYVQRLNGPVFFGSITGFKSVMQDIPADVKIVIIRMKNVPFMDQSGLYAMEAAIKELRDRGTQVLMTIVQPQPKYMLNSTGVIPELVPEECVFKTFEDCTDYLRKTLE